MLTVIKVPQQKAIKISLDVKKYLVDNSLLDISQEELQSVLFGVLLSQGFGEEFSLRFAMVNEFFQLKRPLIVLLCGLPHVGKSTLAQKLAARLNMANVLQTDVMCELLRGEPSSQLSSKLLWHRQDIDSEALLLGEYQKECRIIRRALEGDLFKCLNDGKSVIIEGLHIEPRLYMNEFSDAALMLIDDAVPFRDSYPRVSLTCNSSSQPVFVPIVLRAPAQGGDDREWLERIVDEDSSRSSTLRKLEVLEGYLCSQLGVPVIDVDSKDLEELLHDYLLKCMQLSLGKNEAA